jgi:predicted nucleotidyltransferase
MKTERILTDPILFSLHNLLKKEERILFAFIYGSYASKENTNLSDIDIAVFITDINITKNTTYYILTLECKLESNFSNIKIDVRLLNNAPLITKGTILETGILLFTHNNILLQDFIEETLREYLDYKPIYNNLVNEQYNLHINA